MRWLRSPALHMLALGGLAFAAVMAEVDELRGTGSQPRQSFIAR